MQNNRSKTLHREDVRSYQIKKLALLGLLSALAFLCVLFFRIPVVSFLKFEPKDVIIAIGAFIFGPLSGLAMSVAVSFIEMITISDTGFIGLVMNILSTICFVCPAAVIYRRNRTMRSAVLGLLAGSVTMLVAMVLWNYLITPFYMGIPRQAVAEMLLPVFVPFNLLKAGINAALTLLLYKFAVTGLRKANLIPQNPNEQRPKGKANAGVLIAAGIVLVSCMLLVLVLNGTI